MIGFARSLNHARRCLWTIAVAAGASGCAAPLMNLPTGPGVASPAGAAALADATAACSDVSTLTAEVTVSGSVGGNRMRGRLLAGVAAPASARLEAAAPFGAPIFIFVARAGEATLLLVREDRVLDRGDPADVLEAVTGVPLSPADLRTTLTGCAAHADVAGARILDDEWLVIPDGDARRLRPSSVAGRRSRRGARSTATSRMDCRTPFDSRARPTSGST
jgi:hypothetical protein